VQQWEEEEGMETTLLKKKNNSMQDSVGNEENGHPVPDSNKTMIIVTRDPVTPTEKPAKKKIWKVSLRNSWRRY
jgi:hypothetical protein